jgi:uncharacterized RDD family membrane protein YckC
MKPGCLSARADIQCHTCNVTDTAMRIAAAVRAHQMPGTRYNAHETDRMRELDGAPLASFSRRAIAFALDLAIGWLLFVVVFVVVILISRGIVGTRISPASDDAVIQLNFFKNWYSVLWWVLYFGLATYFWNGRTPGKRLLGIRVVSLVHGRLGVWHSIERALGYGASTLELGFGFLQYFVHPNRRTVHDRIAETIVVLDKPFASTQARPIHSGVATARDNESSNPGEVRMLGEAAAMPEPDRPPRGSEESRQ